MRNLIQKYAHEPGTCRVLLLDLGQCVCYYGWYPVASLARCARVSGEPVEIEYALRLLEVAVYPSSQNAGVQRESAALARERHLVSLCTDPGYMPIHSKLYTVRYAFPRTGCPAWKFTRFCHGIWAMDGRTGRHGAPCSSSCAKRPEYKPTLLTATIEHTILSKHAKYPCAFVMSSLGAAPGSCSYRAKCLRIFR